MAVVVASGVLHRRAAAVLVLWGGAAMPFALVSRPGVAGRCGPNAFVERDGLACPGSYITGAGG